MQAAAGTAADAASLPHLPPLPPPRLEQLLVMGSLVLKEESGYRAFFHHLIRPHEHYLPVWKEVRHPRV